MRGVLVIGDVINDVIVQPAGPTAVDTDTSAVVTAMPGGSGANQAAWLAALGVRVRLAARVGTADADDHLQLLLHAGVDPRLAEDGTLPTGSIVVVVGDDGTRSMYTDRGANARLSVDDLGAGLLEGISHLHVTGHVFIEPSSRAAVSSLWATAGAMGLTRSVDIGSAGFLQGIGGHFLEWTEGADVVFANPAEGRIVAGLDQTAGHEEVLATLLRHYPLVVLKLGPEGAIVATGSSTTVCPPADGVVVDPTGAGDAFCAAFLERWLAGDAPPEVCASATRAAATAMALVGGRPPPLHATGAAPPWARLRAAARGASSVAYAPYSGLRVGAAAVTDDGRIVTGCNVENASFGLTLCAECGLVSALRAAGAERLVAVSVVAHDGEPLAPCGRCRQLLVDNGGVDLLVDRGPVADPIRLGDLLPGAFSAEDLSARRQRSEP